VEGRRPLETARVPALQEAIEAALRADGALTREIALGGAQEKVIQASLAAILESGRTIGAVAVFHDVTELKRLERVRREFVANVSHELRTPLTVIGGFAETLLDDDLDRYSPEARQLLARWGRFQAVRLVLGIAAFVTLVFAWR